MLATLWNRSFPMLAVLLLVSLGAAGIVEGSHPLDGIPCEDVIEPEGSHGILCEDDDGSVIVYYDINVEYLEDVLLPPDPPYIVCEGDSIVSPFVITIDPTYIEGYPVWGPVVTVYIDDPSKYSWLTFQEPGEYDVVVNISFLCNDTLVCIRYTLPVTAYDCDCSDCDYNIAVVPICEVCYAESGWGRCGYQNGPIWDYPCQQDSIDCFSAYVANCEPGPFDPPAPMDCCKGTYLPEVQMGCRWSWVLLECECYFISQVPPESDPTPTAGGSVCDDGSYPIVPIHPF